MAKDSSIGLKDFWAELPRNQEYFLGEIRHWDNIQIAVEEDVVWLKGFNNEQVKSKEVLQIPGLVFYELKEGLLFKKEAIIPTKKSKSALFWMPIAKGIRLEFPITNSNFFGIDGKVEVKIVASDEEKEAVAMLTDFNKIKFKIGEIPKYKLNRIQWVLVQEDALFLGIPLLSLPGKTFWMKNNHLMPSGFDFEYKNMSVLLEKKYNDAQEYYLLWEENGRMLPIKKDVFKPLSLSSIRKTNNQLE